MIWECTVCTNHFDGPSPPDGCGSCGSPREYFTAYHYYGIWPPPGQLETSTPPKAAERPSYTESAVQSATCFRFHSAKYFHPEPQQFYQNFLESRHSFFARNRFAGRGFNSGFYFATTVDAAIAEKTHYDMPMLSRDVRDPLVVMQKARGDGKRCIFLQVTVSLERVADLTDPVVLEYFMREALRADVQLSGIPYELARGIVPPTAGGSDHTNAIGYYVSSGGWSAVKFPSVRALNAAWDINHLSRTDILTKTARDHPHSAVESIEEQIRKHAIIVVFSGSLLTRSISRYKWIDHDGLIHEAENPYFAIDSNALESVRLAHRDRERLTPAQAVELGFLSDAEISDEYAPQFVMWVSKKESI